MGNFGITRLVAVTLQRVEGVAGLLAFNVPAIITNEAPNASFGVSNRAKIYSVSELATVGTDFGTGTEAYKAARAIVSQRPTVDRFVIIKRDAAVATAKTITWSGNFAVGETITGTVNGDAISVAWNTDQSTTMGDLNTAIAAAYGVNTSSGTANVNTVTADAEFPLEITISAAGGNAPTAVIATSTPGRTIADDLTAAAAETSTNLWYTVYNAQANAGQHLSAAAWAEAQTKLYFGQSSEAAIITNATTDIMSRLSAAGYTRSVLAYRATLTDHALAAVLGRCLAVAEGQISFANKTLAGVTPDALSASQLAFIDSKNGNAYTLIANQGVFTPGVALDGNAIEVWRDLDYLVNELNEAFLNLLTANDKIPTTTGPQLVEGTGQAVLNRLVTEGVLNPGNGSTVDAPTFSVITPTAGDITARQIRATVSGTYAGSFIKVVIAATINLA